MSKIVSLQLTNDNHTGQPDRNVEELVKIRTIGPFTCASINMTAERVHATRPCLALP